MIRSLIQNQEEALKAIHDALREIHAEGPVHPETFERLAYVKRFHGEQLKRYEATLVSLMGLFFKSNRPSSLVEEVYSIYSDSIKDETGHSFTPTQAHVYKEITSNKYFSFSAPTSAGKSFLFRELIRGATDDIVIVVPSRALIAEYYDEVIRLVDKSVLVLQFIEDVNRAHASRRIFIVTPERGAELFKYQDAFKIGMFLLDEAQISEEPIRGMKFDSFVRRADRAFPAAKKVFAHPFISNPQAQLLKHGLSRDSQAKSYELHTVGKIFAYYKSGAFHYFSPYADSSPVKAKEDPVTGMLTQGGTLLVFISKSKIYEGEYIADFGKYIDLCPKVTDRTALNIIEELRRYIGAGRGDSEKRSTFIEMMTRGIVVHHGSMPLKARLLIEQYIRSGCARICFATSTLNQGINMPFDIVWIDNFNRMKPLTIKNLIGRSGRSTPKLGSFDYGYTILNSENVKTFTKRMMENVQIQEKSSLDQDLENIPEDFRDIVEAVKEDTFNQELNLPQSQVDRISEANLDGPIEAILDNLMVDNVPISGQAYYDLGEVTRKAIKAAFKEVYSFHLRRKTLSKGEASVLSTAIPILLWKVQGKSFGEIVSLRYAFLSERDKRRAILRQAKEGEITGADAKTKIDTIPIRFSPIAEPLPNSNLRSVPLFPAGSTFHDIDFDVIVYDTYDYLDKVISLSLIDPICAALEIFWRKNGDPRSLTLSNYLRYGTDDNKEIWLLKYGFDTEDLEWIAPHIASIDQDEIRFKDSIHTESEERKRIVDRFL